MLKYLPQLEKKNKDGKASGGKIARQVTTLKTTLKHTTDNAVLLEKSITEKAKESEELIHRLEIAESEAQQKEQEVFGFQIENVLNKKIKRQINQSKLMVLQHEGKIYEDLAGGKYKPVIAADNLQSQLMVEKAQGDKLESILKDFIESKPEYTDLVSMLLNWE